METQEEIDVALKVLQKEQDEGLNEINSFRGNLFRILGIVILIGIILSFIIPSSKQKTIDGTLLDVKENYIIVKSFPLNKKIYMPAANGKVVTFHLSNNVTFDTQTDDYQGYLSAFIGSGVKVKYQQTTVFVFGIRSSANEVFIKSY